MIARLAARQHGVVTRRQMLEAGIELHSLEYRLKIGRLHRIHRQVYAVGHFFLSPLTRSMAAVLACGNAAVLSHRSAAALWGIRAPWRGPVEVTARSNHAHRGVLVHRSRTLTAGDVTLHFGIPITTPLRTLLDLADALADVALTRAVNEAQVQHRLRLDELAELLDRSPGRRATGRLRRFVDRPSRPTRSVFEDAFLAFVDRYRLPRPEVNQDIAGWEVDMVWRTQRLIAELDSRDYHQHEHAFERDREKDADLVAAGYRVIRVTWRRLVRQPGREATRLRSLLGDGERAPR